MPRLIIVFAEYNDLTNWYFLLFKLENNCSDAFVSIPGNSAIVSSSTFILIITCSVTTAEDEAVTNV